VPLISQTIAALSFGFTHERGDNSPTLDTVILLAKVLNVEASDILREMEQQK